MRAKEFIINIPINIKIDGDGEPVISTSPADNNCQAGAQNVNTPPGETLDDELGEFVPPLQKKMELMKKAAGVESVYDEADQASTAPTDVTFDDDDPIES